MIMYHQEGQQAVSQGSYILHPGKKGLQIFTHIWLDPQEGQQQALTQKFQALHPGKEGLENIHRTDRREFFKDFRPNVKVNGKYLFTGKGAGYRGFQVLYIQVKRAGKYSHSRSLVLDDFRSNEQ
jgi:hypothetical protein